MPRIDETREDIIGDCHLNFGNCLNYLNYLEWHSVDVVLMDPPYGINYQTNVRQVMEIPDVIAGDEDLSILESVLPTLAGKLKVSGAIYCFCSPKNIEEVLRLFKSTSLKVKNILIWDKSNWGAGDLYGSYGSTYEPIIYATKGDHKLRRRYGDIFRVSKLAAQVQLHHNQKPVRLLKRLIRNSSNVGDLVIDPFMGSASTGEACMRTKRRFWGCEVSPEFYAKSVDRLKTLHAKLNPPETKTGLPTFIGKPIL